MLPEGEACPPEVFAGLLERLAPAFGISLSGLESQGLSRFLAELDQARRLTNLTGPLSGEQLAEHACESILGERLIPHGARVIDIGTGAGFPGIPLAIVREDIRVTALEPRRKRAHFLRRTAASLGLSNCEVVQGRAQTLRARTWSVAVCRAVGQIEEILARADWLEPGGLFVSWTTDAKALAHRLDPVYLLESQIAVAGSERKVIAVFRKSTVPRGTMRRGSRTGTLHRGAPTR